MEEISSHLHPSDKDAQELTTEEQSTSQSVSPVDQHQDLVTPQSDLNDADIEIVHENLQVKSNPEKQMDNISNSLEGIKTDMETMAEDLEVMSISSLSQRYLEADVEKEAGGGIQQPGGAPRDGPSHEQIDAMYCASPIMQEIHRSSPELSKLQVWQKFQSTHNFFPYKKTWKALTIKDLVEDFKEATQESRSQKVLSPFQRIADDNLAKNKNQPAGSDHDMNKGSQNHAHARTSKLSSEMELEDADALEQTVLIAPGKKKEDLALYGIQMLSEQEQIETMIKEQQKGLILKKKRIDHMKAVEDDECYYSGNVSDGTEDGSPTTKEPMKFLLEDGKEAENIKALKEPKEVTSYHMTLRDKRSSYDDYKKNSDDSKKLKRTSLDNFWNMRSGVSKNKPNIENVDSNELEEGNVESPNTEEMKQNDVELRSKEHQRKNLNEERKSKRLSMDMFWNTIKEGEKDVAHVEEKFNNEMKRGSQKIPAELEQDVVDIAAEMDNEEMSNPKLDGDDIERSLTPKYKNMKGQPMEESMSSIERESPLSVEESLLNIDEVFRASKKDSSMESSINEDIEQENVALRSKDDQRKSLNEERKSKRLSMDMFWSILKGSRIEESDLEGKPINEKKRESQKIEEVAAESALDIEPEEQSEMPDKRENDNSDKMSNPNLDKVDKMEKALLNVDEIVHASEEVEEVLVDPNEIEESNVESSHVEEIKQEDTVLRSKKEERKSLTEERKSKRLSLDMFWNMMRGNNKEETTEEEKSNNEMKRGSHHMEETLKETEQDIETEKQTESELDIELEDQTESEQDIVTEEQTESELDIELEDQTESEQDIETEEQTESRLDIELEDQTSEQDIETEEQTESRLDIELEEQTESEQDIETEEQTESELDIELEEQSDVANEMEDDKLEENMSNHNQGVDDIKSSSTSEDNDFLAQSPKEARTGKEKEYPVSFDEVEENTSNNDVVVSSHEMEETQIDSNDLEDGNVESSNTEEIQQEDVALRSKEEKMKSLNEERKSKRLSMDLFWNIIKGGKKDESDVEEKLDNEIKRESLKIEETNTESEKDLDGTAADFDNENADKELFNHKINEDDILEGSKSSVERESPVTIDEVEETTYARDKDVSSSEVEETLADSNELKEGNNKSLNTEVLEQEAVALRSKEKDRKSLNEERKINVEPSKTENEVEETTSNIDEVVALHEKEDTPMASNDLEKGNVELSNTEKVQQDVALRSKGDQRKSLNEERKSNRLSMDMFWNIIKGGKKDESDVDEKSNNEMKRESHKIDETPAELEQDIETVEQTEVADEMDNDDSEEEMSDTNQDEDDIEISSTPDDNDLQSQLHFEPITSAERESTVSTDEVEHTTSNAEEAVSSSKIEENLLDSNDLEETDVEPSNNEDEVEETTSNIDEVVALHEMEDTPIASNDLEKGNVESPNTEEIEQEDVALRNKEDQRKSLNEERKSKRLSMDMFWNILKGGNKEEPNVKENQNNEIKRESHKIEETIVEPEQDIETEEKALVVDKIDNETLEEDMPNIDQDEDEVKQITSNEKEALSSSMEEENLLDSNELEETNVELSNTGDEVEETASNIDEVVSLPEMEETQVDSNELEDGNVESSNTEEIEQEDVALRSKEENRKSLNEERKSNRLSMDMFWNIIKGGKKDETDVEEKSNNVIKRESHKIEETPPELEQDIETEEQTKIDVDMNNDSLDEEISNQNLDIDEVESSTEIEETLKDSNEMEESNVKSSNTEKIEQEDVALRSKEENRKSVNEEKKSNRLSMDMFWNIIKGGKKDESDVEAKSNNVIKRESHKIGETPAELEQDIETEEKKKVDFDMSNDNLDEEMSNQNLDIDEVESSTEIEETLKDSNKLEESNVELSNTEKIGQEVALRSKEENRKSLNEERRSQRLSMDLLWNIMKGGKREESDVEEKSNNTTKRESHKMEEAITEAEPNSEQEEQLELGCGTSIGPFKEERQRILLATSPFVPMSPDEVSQTNTPTENLEAIEDDMENVAKIRASVVCLDLEAMEAEVMRESFRESLSGEQSLAMELHLADGEQSSPDGDISTSEDENVEVITSADDPSEGGQAVCAPRRTVALRNPTANRGFLRRMYGEDCFCVIQ